MTCVLLKGEIGAQHPINDIAFKNVLAQCHGPLNIVIDTAGGDVCHALAINAMLIAYEKEGRGKIITISRRAYSAGGLIFVAAERRGVEPGENRLMIHSARGGSGPMLQAAHSMMLDAYCKASIYGDQIRAQIASGDDIYYTATEAVAYGLANFHVERPVQDWEIDRVIA